MHLHVCLPACLPAALSVLLRANTARLDGPTDRVEVHEFSFTSPRASFLSGRQARSSQEVDFLNPLWSCPGNAAIELDRPRPFSSNSPNMLLFDIRHPSRDA